MQYSTLALASSIIIFTIYTSYMTLKSPNELIKLKYMRAKLGVRSGTLIHTVIYIVIPLIFAYFMFKAGLNNVTIMQFITE